MGKGTKRLFSIHGYHTLEAMELKKQATNVLSDIFTEWIDKGYQIQDIQNVLNETIFHITIDKILNISPEFKL